MPINEHAVFDLTCGRCGRQFVPEVGLNKGRVNFVFTEDLIREAKGHGW